MGKKVTLVEAGPRRLLPDERWQFAGFELRVRCRQLLREGQFVELEPKPLNLLLLLLRAEGRLVEKSQLIEELWGSRVVSEGVITSCVNKLRLALGESAATLVKSVHGYGYRFGGLASRLQAASTEQTFTPSAGASVPQRPQWVLHAPLDERGGHWMAHAQGSTHPRVFRWALDATELQAVQRHVAVSDALFEQMGARAPLRRVLDQELIQAPCFIAFEHQDEVCLAEWLQRGGAAVLFETRLALAMELVDCIALLHSRGLLHGDLRASCLMVRLDAGGAVRVVLSDLGSSHAKPDPGQMPETLRELPALLDARASLYRAPERLIGAAATLQSEVFALAVIVYQIIVQDPHGALAPGWERRIASQALRASIAAAAEQEIARRTPSAVEFSACLRRAFSAASQGEQTAPPRSMRQQIKPSGRWGFALAACLLIVVGCGGLVARYGEGVSQPPPTPSQELSCKP